MAKSFINTAFSADRLLQISPKSDNNYRAGTDNLKCGMDVSAPKNISCIILHTSDEKGRKKSDKFHLLQ